MDPRPGRLTPTLIRWSHLADTARHNGNGVTRHVRAGQGWRLSVASISQDADFSTLTGVDRVLTVAHGILELTIDGVMTTMPTSHSRRFAGEPAAFGSPEHTPVTVVNVMTERGRCHAAVTVTRLRGASPPCDALLMLSGMSRSADGQHLHALDTLLGVPAGAVSSHDALVVVVTVKGPA